MLALLVSMARGVNDGEANEETAGGRAWYQHQVHFRTAAATVRTCTPIAWRPVCTAATIMMRSAVSAVDREAAKSDSLHRSERGPAFDIPCTK
jgi:hypothetical protein